MIDQLIIPERKPNLPKQKKSKTRIIRPEHQEMLAACFIGLVAGLIAVLVKKGVGWLGGIRIQTTYLLPNWIVLPLFGIIGGFVAGFLVQYFAPSAYGSGIPQVKAVLAQIPIPLNLKVAVVKLIGSIGTLGSGFPLGREGPTVQTATALSAQLSRWFPSLSHHRRQLIAAGAGAGLAAAFNAPIAGVLFVIEELLKDVSGITLGTAILACFIGDTVSEVLAEPNLRFLNLETLELVAELDAPTASFSLPDIPVFILLGILAGLLGALFNKSILSSITLYDKTFGSKIHWRGAIAGLITGTVIAILPIYFRDSAGLREMLLTGNISSAMAASIFVVGFGLVLVCYGSGVPGGLFAPALTLGGALGNIVGLLAQSWVVTQPTTYALVGMGAFFSAVVRVPVTSIVILTEMTADFNLVLPLMISCVISYLVGEQLFGGSLYDRLLMLKGINLEQKISNSRPWLDFKVATAMQTRVETLNAEMTIEEALQIFYRSQHGVFPVLENGLLVGFFSHREWHNIVKQQIPKNTLVQDVMTPRPIVVSPTSTLNNALHLLNLHQINRLPVTEGNKLVGILTRNDLVQLESGNQLNRDIFSSSEPSFVVDQTREPEVGKGRLLILLNNQETAMNLLRMGIAIASENNYEIECLQVILVLSDSSLKKTSVKTRKLRLFLEKAVILGKSRQVTVHTQIRVAYNLAAATIETIREQNISQIVMDYPHSRKIVNDNFVQLIQQNSCQLILIKWSKQPGVLPNLSMSITAPIKSLKSNNLLVINTVKEFSLKTLENLKHLIDLPDKPRIFISQVKVLGISAENKIKLNQAREYLKQNLNCQINTIPEPIENIEAAKSLAQKHNCDIILVNLTSQELIKQITNKNNLLTTSNEFTVMLISDKSE